MHPKRRATTALGLFGSVQLFAITADRLKQFSFVSMLGLLVPGSSVELLKLNLFMQVPMLLFTPLVGTLLDRWNKGDAIVAACIARSGLLLAIPVTFHRTDSLYSLYAVAALLSVFDLGFASARSGMLPDLVERERLLGANAVFWVLGVAGTLVGLLAGGWVFDNMSWEATFFGNAFVYLLAATFMVPVLLLHGREPASRETRNVAGPVASAREVVREVAESLHLIRRDHWIAVSLISQASLFGMAGVLSVVAIARIQEIAPDGRASFLSVIAASLVLGMIVGSGLSSLFRERVSVQRTVSVAALVAGVAIAGFGRTGSIVPLSIWSGLLGVTISPVFVVTETLIQNHSPREHLGRVFAAREALIKTAYLVAAVVGTALTAFASKTAVLLALGLFLALLGVVLERTRWIQE